MVTLVIFVYFAYFALEEFLAAYYELSVKVRNTWKNYLMLMVLALDIFILRALTYQLANVFPSWLLFPLFVSLVAVCGLSYYEILVYISEVSNWTKSSKVINIYFSHSYSSEMTFLKGNIV